MSPGDVIDVAPGAIRYKLSSDTDLGGIRGGDWDIERRVPIEDTDKYVSIIQRYVFGFAWTDTELFRNRYTAYLAQGQPVRGGARSLSELAAVYEREVDAIFRSLQRDGFRSKGSYPKVHIGRDGEFLLGNNGNHRVAMAKVLELDLIPVRVLTRHEAFYETPELPVCAQAIPAMTKLAERLAYYRLTLEAARRGAVVELGAWLGAATAYIAAAMRDSGTGGKVQVFDRFQWDPSHGPKGATSKDMRGQFEHYLGPLLDHIDVHVGELADMKWHGGPISLIVFDAPKRVREISLVLTKLQPAIRPGTVLAWQDFGYPFSYDIAASMMSLANRVEFVEGVYPGTTAVFRVTDPWSIGEVSQSTIDLKQWTARDIEAAWDTWERRLPVPMRPYFRCGAALFLCDNGHVERARAWLEPVIAVAGEAVLPKWRLIYRERPILVSRYKPLFDMLAQMGAL